MQILLDGWPVLHDPGSPAALHIAAVLATCPPSVQVSLALPGPDPGIEELPASVKILTHTTAGTAWGLATWQQIILPRLASNAQADLILTALPGASLAARTATISSPSGWRLAGFEHPAAGQAQPGFISRLQEALGLGGLQRTRAVLWPEDLPPAKTAVSLVRTPPLVHPQFQINQPTPAIEFWSHVDLPETYVLYHGPVDQDSIERLLRAWSWAAASIAQYYPLLIYGASKHEQLPILSSARLLGLEDSLLLLPPASPVQLAALYYGCSAFFQPGPVSPWGDPIRHAMACAKPVVAATSGWSDSLIGDAGFLAPAEDLRSLGAALITVIVEEDLAERLATRARQRAARWSADGFWGAVLNSGSL